MATLPLHVDSIVSTTNPSNFSENGLLTNISTKTEVASNSTAEATTITTAPSPACDILLVTVGYPFVASAETEIIPITENARVLEHVNLKDSLTGTSESIGGFLLEDIDTDPDPAPIICGGRGYDAHFDYWSDKCRKLGDVSVFAQLQAARIKSASLVVKESDGSKRLWITGGYTKEDNNTDINVGLTTTEYVNGNGGNSIVGPDLPTELYHHCLVQLQPWEKRFMIIGGYATSVTWPSKSTWILDQDWTPGPELNIRRASSSCATIRVKSTGVRMVVVAGGSIVIQDAIDSVEMLVSGSDQWIVGPSLPRAIECAPAVSISNSMALLIVSGITCPDEPEDWTSTQLWHSCEAVKTLYKFECHTSQWTCGWSLLDQSLAVARENSIALTLPRSLTTCS